MKPVRVLHRDRANDHVLVVVRYFLVMWRHCLVPMTRAEGEVCDGLFVLRDQVGARRSGHVPISVSVLED